MDGTLNKPAVATVDTAIILASSGVFDSDGLPATRKTGALTSVGGLTLFQRTVLSLQRGGITQILILAGEEEQALRTLMLTDARIRATLRWLPIREFPPSDPQTWETLAAEVKGACLILGCHTVFSPALVEKLREEGRDGHAVIVTENSRHCGETSNPGVVIARETNPQGLVQRIVFRDQTELSSPPATPSFEEALIAGDVVVLPSRLLGVSGTLLISGDNPIRLALEQAAAEGTLQHISAKTYAYRDTRVPNGPQLAEQTLLQSLQSLKGGLDGIIDTYVNRKLSGIFTRLFVRVGLSPNAVTLLSMLIGLTAAGAFATGTYEIGILGALLFQLSVIIDCCDGEVARLTFTESRLGRELDILADNVVHMAIFAGIAWGAYQYGAWSQTNFPLILGSVAILANGCSLWMVNQARAIKVRPVEWQRLGQSQRAKIDFVLSNVANRDFSVIVLLCSCFDVLAWFLWLAAFGACFFALTMAWILRHTLLPRA